jgi:hypothetical protein
MFGEFGEVLCGGWVVTYLLLMSLLLLLLLLLYPCAIPHGFTMLMLLLVREHVLMTLYRRTMLVRLLVLPLSARCLFLLLPPRCLLLIHHGLHVRHQAGGSLRSKEHWNRSQSMTEFQGEGVNDHIDAWPQLVDIRSTSEHD